MKRVVIFFSALMLGVGGFFLFKHMIHKENNNEQEAHMQDLKIPVYDKERTVDSIAKHTEQQLVHYPKKRVLIAALKKIAGSSMKKEPSVASDDKSSIPGYLLNTARHALSHAQALDQTESSIEILVDFSKPSDEKRLWIINASSGEVLLNTYVAHGVNSGGKYAKMFSNQSGSHKSSIGTFLVKDVYQGQHGKSLRLKGLESTNNQAEPRAIVLHSAQYVSPKVIAAKGQAGHSWGCFVVPPAMIKKVIQITEAHPHSLLLAYYPDKTWLNNSDYV